MQIEHQQKERQRKYRAGIVRNDSDLVAKDHVSFRGTVEELANIMGDSPNLGYRVHWMYSSKPHQSKVLKDKPKRLLVH